MNRREFLKSLAALTAVSAAPVYFDMGRGLWRRQDQIQVIRQSFTMHFPDFKKEMSKEDLLRALNIITSAPPKYRNHYIESLR